MRWPSVSVWRLAAPVLCIGCALGGFAVGVRTASVWAERYSSQKYARVVAELEKLTAAVHHLNQENSALRVAVGLVPLPSDVYAVGVGGRGRRPPEGIPLDQPTWERLDRVSRGIRLLSESHRQVEAKIREQEEILSRIPSISPVPQGVIQSRFGARLHPVFGLKAMHEGIDFAAETGTPVLATADGVVTFSGKYGGYGNLIEIDHGNGLTTRYAHNHVNLVTVGQRVTRGQVIAQVGSSGMTTSSHLHYEVRRDGVPVDPQPYILPGVIVD